MGFKSTFKRKINIGFLLQNKINKIKKGSVPKHVAIIMDGNGRWAQKKGLPRTAGHRQGMEILRNIIELSAYLDIEYLTLYAFSTENWKRPESEIQAIMSLLVEYLQKELDLLNENHVKLSILGDISIFSNEVREEIEKAIELTKNNQGLNVNVALNYGGRMEMVMAIQGISRKILKGDLAVKDIDQRVIADHLYTANIPDPDLLIRTGGDWRISNFLLYQIAYTELWFASSNVFWPDFGTRHYLKAIYDFQNRQRRYGGIIVGKEE